MATGLCAAIPWAMASASLSASSAEGSTRETRPNVLASSAWKFRAVSASSRTSESLPTILGSRASVPTSAASPTAASLMLKKASAEHKRMSQAVIKSTPAPTQAPWTTTIVGFRQRSTALTPSCITEMWLMSLRPLRPMSAAGGGMFPWSVRSRPAEKLLPRADRTTARQSPSASSASKTCHSSFHMRKFIAFRASGRLSSTR
mmetsp:Transcript_53765/g.163270  ORF Transcript_53765/g.163270 Transcript_53765/m.163270 type:complete len:203 (+) Transcript_53765:179-787(+)